MEEEIDLFRCECGTEGLSVEYDKEYEEVYMAVWSLGGEERLPFKERLRYCFRILTKGRPYADQIILSKRTTKELIKKLQEFVND